MFIGELVWKDLFALLHRDFKFSHYLFCAMIGRVCLGSKGMRITVFAKTAAICERTANNV